MTLPIKLGHLLITLLGNGDTLILDGTEVEFNVRINRELVPHLSADDILKMSLRDALTLVMDRPSSAAMCEFFGAGGNSSKLWMSFDRFQNAVPFTDGKGYGIYVQDNNRKTNSGEMTARLTTRKLQDPLANLNAQQVAEVKDSYRLGEMLAQAVEHNQDIMIAGRSADIISITPGHVDAVTDPKEIRQITVGAFRSRDALTTSRHTVNFAQLVRPLGGPHHQIEVAWPNGRLETMTLSFGVARSRDYGHKKPSIFKTGEQKTDDGVIKVPLNILIVAATNILINNELVRIQKERNGHVVLASRDPLSGEMLPEYEFDGNQQVTLREGIADLVDIHGQVHTAGFFAFSSLNSEHIRKADALLNKVVNG